MNSSEQAYKGKKKCELKLNKINAVPSSPSNTQYLDKY